MEVARRGRCILLPLVFSTSCACKMQKLSTFHGVKQPTVVRPAELSSFPCLADIDIQWGDMDAFRHVNNVRYFDYFQEARLKHGLKWDDQLKLIAPQEHLTSIMSGTGISVILKSTSCKYIRPVEWPDTLTIGSRVSDYEQAKGNVVFEYLAWSQRQSKVVAVGDAVMVMYDYSRRRPCPVPGALAALLAEEVRRTQEERRRQ